MFEVRVYIIGVSKPFDFQFDSPQEAQGFVEDVVTKGVWIEEKLRYPAHKVDHLEYFGPGEV